MDITAAVHNALAALIKTFSFFQELIKENRFNNKQRELLQTFLKDIEEKQLTFTVSGTHARGLFDLLATFSAEASEQQVRCYNIAHRIYQAALAVEDLQRSISVDSPTVQLSYLNEAWEKIGFIADDCTTICIVQGSPNYSEALRVCLQTIAEEHNLKGVYALDTYTRPWHLTHIFSMDRQREEAYPPHLLVEDTLKNRAYEVRSGGSVFWDIKTLH